MSWVTARSISRLDAELALSPRYYRAQERHEYSSGVRIGLFAEVLTERIAIGELPQRRVLRIVRADDLQSGYLDCPVKSRPSEPLIGLRVGDCIVMRTRPRLQQFAIVDEGAIKGKYGLWCGDAVHVLRGVGPCEGKSLAFLVPFLQLEQTQKLLEDCLQGSINPQIRPTDLLSLTIPRELFEQRELHAQLVEKGMRTIRDIRHSLRRDSRMVGRMQ